MMSDNVSFIADMMSYNAARSSFEKAMYVALNRDGQPKNSPAFLSPLVKHSHCILHVAIFRVSSQKSFDIPKDGGSTPVCAFIDAINCVIAGRLM